MSPHLPALALAFSLAAGVPAPPPPQAASPSVAASDRTVRAWPDRNPVVDPENWSRYAHGAAVLNGRVYLIGGDGNGGSHSSHARVDVFDLRSRTWSTAADFPTPRAFPAVASLGGRVYAVGGLETKGPGPQRDSAVTERYDPEIDAWEALPPLASPRSRHAAAAVDESGLYVIGGLQTVDGISRDSAAVEKFDAKTGTWSRCADLPTPRHGLCAVATGGRLYALGGYCLKQSLESSAAVEVFDPATGAWSSVAPMSVGRAWFVAAATNDAVFVVGSTSAGGPGPERFDLRTGSWRAIGAPELSGRRSAGVFAEGCVWVFGGEGVGDRFVQVFDTTKGRWIESDPRAE